MSVPSSTPPSIPSPSGERVAKVSLRVRDLAESSGFYTRVFGCRGSEEKSGRARQLRFAPLASSDGDVLELVSGRPVGAVSALDHFSVEVPTANDVEAVYRKTLDEHVRVLPPRDSDNGRRCVIFDPDGYKVEVFARHRHSTGDVAADSVE